MCMHVTFHMMYMFKWVSFDFSVSRTLVVILQESPSAVAIAVAAHDLGEYVRYYPRGKRYSGGWRWEGVTLVWSQCGPRLLQRVRRNHVTSHAC